MKNTHCYIVTLAMLILAFLVKAASEAEFGKLSKACTLYADGSQEVRVQKELALFTHAVMSRVYEEGFIIYNPEFQALRMHDSYTRQKDGTIVKTPGNALLGVLSSAAADTPAYNGLEGMVVVHAGLELGATIYLDYSIVTRPGYLLELDVYEQMGELFPVRKYVFSLSVSESKPLHYEWLNGKATPVVKTAGGMKTVAWTLKNVQPRPYSLNVSLSVGNVRAVVTSTYALEADALRVIKQQLESDGKGVSELAQKLTVGAQTVGQKKKLLTAYIEGLGNCHLTLSQIGYHLRPASEAVRSAYGVEAEKVALLAASQQAIDVRAEIKTTFPRTKGRDTAGLAAVNGLFVTNERIADIQNFVSIVDLNARPIILEKVSRVVSRTDTLQVNDKAGKALADGYRKFDLPQARGGWASYDGRVTALDTTRLVNLLLRYLPGGAYTYIIKVGAGMKPVVVPTNKRIEDAVGIMEVTVKKVEDKIEMFRTLKLKKQLIVPIEYPAYYYLMMEWVDTSGNSLLFQTAK